MPPGQGADHEAWQLGRIGKWLVIPERQLFDQIQRIGRLDIKLGVICSDPFGDPASKGGFIKPFIAEANAETLHRLV